MSSDPRSSDTPNSPRITPSEQKWARLRRHADLIMATQLDNDAVKICKVIDFLLNFYKLEDNQHPISITEARNIEKSMLPRAIEIFSEKVFQSPLYPVALLRDVATTYGFGTIPRCFQSGLQLTSMELNNATIMTHIWFAFMLDCDQSEASGVIDFYKRSRKTVNLLTRGVERFRVEVSPQSASHGTATPAAVQQHPIVNLPSTEVPSAYAPGNRVEASSESPKTHLNVPTINQARGIPHGTPVEANTQQCQRQQDSRAQGGEHDIENRNFTFDNAKKASYVSIYFKDKKFTGDLSQSIKLFLRDYNVW